MYIVKKRADACEYIYIIRVDVKIVFFCKIRNKSWNTQHPICHWTPPIHYFAPLHPHNMYSIGLLEKKCCERLTDPPHHKVSSKYILVWIFYEYLSSKFHVLSKDLSKFGDTCIVIISFQRLMTFTYVVHKHIVILHHENHVIFFKYLLLIIASMGLCCRTYGIFWLCGFAGKSILSLV